MPAGSLSSFFLPGLPLALCSSLSLFCPVLSCAALCGAVLFCSAGHRGRLGSPSRDAHPCLGETTVKAQEEGRGEHKPIWTTGACPVLMGRPGVIVEDRRGGARSAPNGPDTAATSSATSASWLWLWISTAPRSSGCHAPNARRAQPQRSMKSLSSLSRWTPAAKLVSGSM